jgi:Na+/H+-dicarboxylate symporter
MQQKRNNSNQLLLKYLSFAFQIFIGLGLMVFCGFKIDDWRYNGQSFFTWILPLAYIIIILIKAIKDTQKK